MKSGLGESRVAVENFGRVTVISDTVQPKNNARARIYVRKPGNFLRQIADACACVLRTARTSLRLVSFNSKNFFAVRPSKRKNFFASQRFNRARDRTLL